ncbi:MAG: hypothetical protein BGO87_00760 [Flavobacteriia bacterium 40-80]|nr:MAG: hypothetical protein BGO87_00760 [Flavobacteriia bacterium 40-80]
MSNRIKLQRAAIILFAFILVCFYSYAALIYCIFGKEAFLKDPKELVKPFSFFSELISFLWFYISYALVLFFIISLFFRSSRSDIIRMGILFCLFLILNYTDPFGIINWILD